MPKRANLFRLSVQTLATTLHTVTSVTINASFLYELRKSSKHKSKKGPTVYENVDP